jgi:hypothetical protein
MIDNGRAFGATLGLKHVSPTHAYAKKKIDGFISVARNAPAGHRLFAGLGGS